MKLKLKKMEVRPVTGQEEELGAGLVAEKMKM